MRYQIIGKYSDCDDFVLYKFDDLELATNKLDFIAELVASDKVNPSIDLPSLKSIELQQFRLVAVLELGSQHDQN